MRKLLIVSSIVFLSACGVGNNVNTSQKAPTFQELRANFMDMSCSELRLKFDEVKYNTLADFHSDNSSIYKGYSNAQKQFVLIESVYTEKGC